MMHGQRNIKLFCDLLEVTTVAEWYHRNFSSSSRY